jgi:UDP-3-O-[3-hydroxymyristoyl] N-acetylglucosamine deacetylase/3-hydroxyacyl-[acyl-carrier-protein] dehydratase
MTRARQRTIGRKVSLDGIGIHLGEPASVSFHPAKADSGVLFRRVDLPGKPEIPATLDHVVGTELGTSIGRGKARILTVEHLMAALGASEIANVRVDLSGPEVPIRDGSFLDFLNVIEEAGVVEQDAPAHVVQLDEPVVLRAAGDESYIVAPDPELRITATIDFEHPAIGRQTGSFEVSGPDFRADIAPARTFGFLSEAEQLRARGLALGASLENTVVLDDRGVANNGLRFPDEFLRHKVGDVLGDLTLLGTRLRGHVVAERPSHRGNIELGRLLKKLSGAESASPEFDIDRIQSYLPHRYPMLLVDRIVSTEGRRIVGIKNVSINEPYFQGHFPERPIMPGVLIVEAMAQIGGLLLIDSVGNPRDKKVYLMSINKARFRRPVRPGDQLVCKVELLRFRRGICRMKGEAFVDGNLVAEAEFMAKVTG